VRPFTEVGLFCRDTRLFCGAIGLFCGQILAACQHKVTWEWSRLYTFTQGQCNTLQHTAAHCSTLQKLQHTAAHCITLRFDTRSNDSDLVSSLLFCRWFAPEHTLWCFIQNTLHTKKWVMSHVYLKHMRLHLIQKALAIYECRLWCFLLFLALYSKNVVKQIHSFFNSSLSGPYSTLNS